MKITLIITTALLLSTLSYSQSFYSVDYTMSKGLGETGDYINKFSFRGLTVEGRGFLNENWSLGGLFTWTTFYEKYAEETFTSDDITVTGTQYRYLNAFPLLFQAHYYLSTEDDKPWVYFGAGTGAYKMVQRTNTGIWSVENNNWHFGISPEVGVFYPISHSTGINLSLKYHYVFKASGTTDHSWLGLNIGIGWGN